MNLKRIILAAAIGLQLGSGAKAQTIVPLPKVSDRPRFVDTVADLGDVAGLRDGDAVKTLGEASAADGLANTYIYHATGRPGFEDRVVFGPGADDYFEPVDSTVGAIAKPALTRVGVWRNPAATATTDETPVDVHTVTNGIGLVVRYHETAGTRSIEQLFEGTPKNVWQAPIVADTLSVIAGKSSFQGFDYYNLDGAEYIEYDYDGTEDLDELVVGFYSNTGSSGVAEIVRNRATVLTVVGEVDTDAGVTTGYAEALVTLTGTIQTGDSIRLRQKSGEAQNCRIEWVLGCKAGTATSNGTLYVADTSAITKSSSSLEWACSMAPDGETQTFIGNSGHVGGSNKQEDHISETWLIDGVSATIVSEGLRTGTLEIERRADVDWGSDQQFVSYEMTTAFTVDGVWCGGRIIPNEACDYNSRYVAMLPAVTSVTSLTLDGGSPVDISALDDSWIELGYGRIADVGTTPGGNQMRMTVNQRSRARILLSSVASYKKLYFSLDALTGVNDLAVGESLPFGWLLELR